MKYTKTHVWIRYHPGENVPEAYQTGYVGITYYAQRKLKDINKLTHPIIGTLVDKGESLGTVESPYLKLELISPVTGAIFEVVSSEQFNEEVEKDLKKVNLDAESQHLVALKVSNPAELDDLLGIKEYEAFTEHEE